ncbi:MAG: hypothetical protein JWN23_1562 [Rhodocyclales bacterium]|nr:hypothetical protein [Rhodocyclales bacterium]
MTQIYFTVPEDKMTHEGVIRHALGAAGSRCVAVRAEIRELEMSLQSSKENLEKAQAIQQELSEALQDICRRKSGVEEQ